MMDRRARPRLAARYQIPRSSLDALIASAKAEGRPVFPARTAKAGVPHVPKRERARAATEQGAPWVPPEPSVIRGPAGSAERAESLAEFEAYVAALHPAERLEAIVAQADWRHPLARPEELRALLARWWPESVVPESLSMQRIVSAFRRAKFVTNAEDLGPPTERLAVYRGVRRRTGDKEPRSGVDWTTDRLRAERAASGPQAAGYEGLLYAAELVPTAVLGLFRVDGAIEVAVSPGGLRNRTLLARVDLDPGAADPEEPTGA